MTDAYPDAYTVRITPEAVSDLVRMLGSQQMLTTGVSLEIDAVTKTQRLTISYLEADTELAKSIVLDLIPSNSK